MTLPEQSAQPDQHLDTDVLGRRIGAAVLDLLVLSVLFAVMSTLLGSASAEEDGVSVSLSGLPFLLWLVLVFLYYVLQERSDGQTLGKRALGVRVVAADGSPAGTGPIAVRTALRAIDSLPVFYLVGLLSVLVTGSKKARVGDLAASTRVVRA